MRTIKTDIYQFDELSDLAKEKARVWWRSGFELDHDSIFEDVATIADLFGLDICRNGEPAIYYTGFSSQGDGACFQGRYTYKPGALKAVKQYAPKDEDLHRIVAGLQAAQKPYFYKLTADCNHSGHYYHSGCMVVEVIHAEDEYRDIGDGETELRDLLRQFADWIYSQLREAYFAEMEDDQVDDNIRANEYEFTEDGRRA